MAESKTPASIFEGMFQRGMKVDSGLKAKLLAAGYDLDRPQATYPTPVWVACVEVAAVHAYGGMAREQAMRQLGRRFIDGFFETILGKLVSAPMPLLKTEKLVERIGKTMSLERPDTIGVVTNVGPKHYLLTVQDAFPLPDFVAGNLEGLLTRAKVQPQVEVAERRPNGYALTLRWT
jgi:uncharacterized protein (TIGR02265 family)